MTRNLDERMKQYEYVTRTYLTRKIPAIIRIDGRAFHTFTKGFKKPFDMVFMSAMQNTMKSLCEQIQGCVFGYTQSDEITLVLTDYANVDSDAWFGYNIQKMASIAASMTTLYFNKHFREAVSAYASCASHEEEYVSRLYSRFDSAMFDARAFSLPKEEVCNCLIWRQQDAVRNSIQAVGQAYFSTKQLDGKSNDEVKVMLLKEHDIDWTRYFPQCRRGSCCYKNEKTVRMEDPRNPGMQITVQRRVWELDNNIPLFVVSRDYIERWL